jgi:hypothetical protein
MPAPGVTRRMIHEQMRLRGDVGAAETGVGASMQGLAESGGAGLNHLQLVTTAAKTITLGATGNRGGGVKLFEFDELGIVPVGARIRATVSLTAETATFGVGEYGLGTTVATGNIAVLSGTAGFQNLAKGTPGTAIGAAGAIDQDIIFGVGERTAVDGLDTGVSLHLNVAGAVGEATTNMTVAAGAIIDLWYLAIPPSS